MSDFTSVARIGRGIFGWVDKVQDSEGKDFARKIIGQMDKQSSLLFETEAETLYNLDHPNIVHLYEAGYDDHGRGELIMEYCDGGDLDRVFNSRWDAPRQKLRLSNNDGDDGDNGDTADNNKLSRNISYTYFNGYSIWHVVCCIAAGLSRCHRGLQINKDQWRFEQKVSWIPVLHRNIKPENILLSGPGDWSTSFPVIKLGGFGSSKILQAKSSTFSIAGSPLFWAPEIRTNSDLLINGQEAIRGAWTEKADIWSFGCVIFRMMTLDPTIDLTDAEAFNAEAFNRYEDDDLRDIVRQMLSPNQFDRPTSTEILRIALQHTRANPCLGYSSDGLDTLRRSLAEPMSR